MTNKKQKEIKALTWKYFRRQKLEEIGKFLFGSILFYGFIGWLPYVLLNVYNDFEQGVNKVWIDGALYLWLFCLIFLIGCFSYLWLIDNWEKANKRAKEEYSKNLKGGNKK